LFISWLSLSGLIQEAVIGRRKIEVKLSFLLESLGNKKGTGRARAGRASSPIWRSGGKVFPSSPAENFTKKVNKKMYKAAMQCIFSQLVREDRLFIISEPGSVGAKNKTDGK
jgi:ribosomal protein L4